MRTLADQVLLVLSASALASAAFRVASLAAPRGLERVVATFPLAAAVAVAEALVLGRFGLSGSPLALALAAGMTLAGVRVLLPAPALGAAAELRELTPRAAAALAGAGAGAVAWAELHPVLGYDAATYHLSEAVIWAQKGSAGSIEPVIAGLPVGNYPVTNEVAISWLFGLSHSFAPLAFWSTLLALAFVAASLLGLRSLGVPSLPAWLTVAAFSLTPLVLKQIVQNETDFPGLAWLAVCGGLCAAALRRPALLAPALLAAALAVGTKTTTAPLAALALVVTGVRLRAQLRPLGRPLALAALLGTVVGGSWYLRNLIVHGSPSWPLITTPWGDPRPPILRGVDASFLERPAATLAGRAAGFYRDQLAGLILVFVAGVLAPLWARSRATLLAAAAALGGLLIWASAPYTGSSDLPAFAGLPLNTLRYISPALAAGALALALSAREGRRAALVAGAVALAAVGWNLARYLSDPYLPSDTLFTALVAVGAGAGVLIARLGLAPRILAAALLAASVAGLALAAPGWPDRQGRSTTVDAGLVNWFGEQRAWRDGTAPIGFAPTVFAAPAGERFQHRLSLVAPGEGCTSVRARARRGWVVVQRAPRVYFPPLSAPRCLAGLPPLLNGDGRRIYGPRR